MSVEQTTNIGGGRVWPLESLRAVVDVASAHGLRTHLDGARLMNAVVASGTGAADFAHGFDTAWIDFTKGLGAPVGAVLAASAAFDFSRLWYFSPPSFAVILQRAGLTQTGYSSVLAELDTTLNYLRYDDPYEATFREEVLPADVIERLEQVVLGSDLGYKFLSLARPTSINRS